MNAAIAMMTFMATPLLAGSIQTANVTDGSIKVTYFFGSQ